MAIDPELAAFLELAELGRIERDDGRLHEMPVARARALYTASSAVLDQPEPGLNVTIRDGAVPVADRPPIPIRVYRPANMPEPPWGVGDPVTLFLHGGGYSLGDLDSHDTLCRRLAAFTPSVVVAVDYRLSPEHRFPAAFEDAVAAWEWLTSHGAEWGLVADRAAVAGDSVGAAMASALCLHLRDRVRDRGGLMPRAQALLYPCVAGDLDSDSHRRFAEGYLLEADTLRWMFDNHLPDPAARRDRRFAPLHADDLSGAPPALVVVAECDPLLDEGVAYADRLRVAGGEVTLSRYDGMVHDFARLGTIVPQAERVAREIGAFLATHLSGTG